MAASSVKPVAAPETVKPVPRWRIVAGNIHLNVALNWKQSSEGSTHLSWPVSRSVEYIRTVYRDYLEYGGLDEDSLEGSSVLEIGPGDNLGVALLLAAAGTRKVVCVDRFQPVHNPAQQARIYGALREQLSGDALRRFDDAVDLGAAAGPIFNPERVHCYYGTGAERVDRFLPAEGFDLVISRAVLFRIWDVRGCWRALGRVLAPGGKMIHKVALIDWIFRRNGHHPLEFLTVPTPLYRLMAGNTGICNRYTVEDYRRLAGEFGYETEIHVTRVLGGESGPFPPNTAEIREGVHFDSAARQLVRDIRPRLLPRFQALSDEALLTEDFFVVATKPDHQGRRETRG